MGQALIDKHFGHNVKSVETFQDANVYYKLLDDIETEALNSGTMSDCEPRPGNDRLLFLPRKFCLHFHPSEVSRDIPVIILKSLFLC